MSAQDWGLGGDKKTHTPLALRISNFFFLISYILSSFVGRMLRTVCWGSLLLAVLVAYMQKLLSPESRGVGAPGVGGEERRRGKPCRNIFIYTFIHFSRRALLAAGWIISKSEYKIMIIHICMNTRVNLELTRISLLSGRCALNAGRIVGGQILLVI